VELVDFAVVVVETGLVVLAPLVAVAVACASTGWERTAETTTTRTALTEGISL
jgi:hypothetical protein